MKEAILQAILDCIIPSSDEFGMKGAWELINGDVKDFDQKTPLNILVESFVINNNSKNSLKDQVSEYLNFEKKNNPRLYNEVIFYVFKLYYSNQKVLEKISIQPSPPFPKGSIIEESDLLIFGDVFLRGKIYKDIK